MKNILLPCMLLLCLSVNGQRNYVTTEAKSRVPLYIEAYNLLQESMDTCQDMNAWIAFYMVQNNIADSITRYMEINKMEIFDNIERTWGIKHPNKPKLPAKQLYRYRNKKK